jgi:3,4-dihydroxy 2-butanone 4-phosphate synthase/GTP cyclohydrolase II
MTIVQDTLPIAPFAEVLEAYRQGKMVIMVDDQNRENEGDLCLATEFVTPEAIQYMASEGRGLICVTMGAELAASLQLPPQAENNNSPFHTPFTVSIDHVSVASCGALPASRALTMRKLLEQQVAPSDFKSPGSVFPLVANPAGVLGRQGQTEGSYDLARLAGLYPSSIICEILAEDGTMLRGDALVAYAQKHNLLITSVEEVIRARISGEALVRKISTYTAQLELGAFQVTVFRDDATNREHFSVQYGDPRKTKDVLVRIHSECLTGDVFGSLRCDCGDQLQESLRRIVAEGAGVVLYLRQEGRGIGLANKLKAYALQDTGLDTVEANERLGFAADERDFQVAVGMLDALQISSIRLLTNNPEKLDVLTHSDITIVERLPLVVKENPYSSDYLAVKKSKLGHLFQ